MVEKAQERRTVTYGDAAAKVGGIARGLGATLRPIQAYCKANRLPNLSVLVVKADSGKQGSGFTDDPKREKMLVFGHDWRTVANPFEARSDS